MHLTGHAVRRLMTRLILVLGAGVMITFCVAATLAVSVDVFTYSAMSDLRIADGVLWQVERWTGPGATRIISDQSPRIDPSLDNFVPGGPHELLPAWSPLRFPMAGDVPLSRTDVLDARGWP